MLKERLQHGGAWGAMKVWGIVAQFPVPLPMSTLELWIL